MTGINDFGGDAAETKVDQAALDQASKDDRIVSEQWGAYTRARDAGHTEYVTDARKFDDYYYGDQWDDNVKATLDAQGRPAHTINLVLSTVNAVVGEYIKSRQDITFKPMGKGASLDTATALRFLFKQLATNNKSEHKEKTVFLDGLIQDRGYFYYYLDFSDNIEGEIRELIVDPTDVIIDPGAKEYDPETWSEAFISRWMTPDEIGALYGPEFAEKLKHIDGTGTFGHDSIEFESPTFAGTFHDSDIFGQASAEDVKRVKRVRVIERQYKKLTRTAFFVDRTTGDMRRVPEGWGKDKIIEFATNLDLHIIWKPERRVRVVVTADRILLHDGWSLFSRISIIPFFPYFRRGRPFGLVRNLISPQDMLNKVTSQELHVVNTTANSGWIFESGSLVNMDADDLMTQGAKTGLVIEHAKGSEAPTKITPNQIPSGLNEISAKAGVFFKEISGVNEALLGAGRSDSSKALESRRQGGLVQQEIIFDNLDYTRELRAELMLEVVQNYYTETRLIQVFEKNEDGDDIEGELLINEPGPEDEILNDLTLGEYSVVISSVARRDTFDESVFDQLQSMREAGVQIPDFVLVENSLLSNKGEIVEMMKKAAGLAAPTEEELEEIARQKEIQFRLAEAEVMEKEAEAIERRANAQKLAAEAGFKVQQPQLEQARLGAEIRKDLEIEQIRSDTNRDDLAARLAIARDKGETTKTVAQIDSMTKRTQGALTRQTDLDKALLTLRDSADRSRTSDNKPPTKA